MFVCAVAFGALPTAKSYRPHRFPSDVIAHVVWLCFRLPSSPRMVENLLEERGIVVSHQTVQTWAVKRGLFCEAGPAPLGRSAWRQVAS